MGGKNTSRAHNGCKEQVEEMKCKLKQSKREIQQEEVQKLRKERDVMKWGDALKEIVNQM